MAKINEHKTLLQSNYGWGLSLNMTGKAPAVTKRIWDKLTDAQAYVDLSTESAIAGLTLRVVNDDEKKNGVYFVKQAAGEQIYKEGQEPSKNDPVHKNGILVKLAGESDFDEKLTKIREAVGLNSDGTKKENDGKFISGKPTVESEIKSLNDHIDNLTYDSSIINTNNTYIKNITQEDGKISTTTCTLVSPSDPVLSYSENGINSDIELKKLSASELSSANLGSNVLEAYKLVGKNKGNDNRLGDFIKVYKDKSLKSVSLEGTEGKTQNLVFTYIKADGSDEVVRLDVSKFLAESEFKNGLEVNGNGEVSIRRDTAQNDTNNFMTLGSNGIGLNGITNAINAKGNEITNIINGLDLGQIGSDGSYIKYVSQSNGQLSATKQAFDTSLNLTSTNAPQTKVVKSAIDAIGAASTTEVKEGTDNSHLSISYSNNGHPVYTITLTDVASHNTLANHIANYNNHNHDDRYVNIGGDTMTGNLTVGSGNSNVKINTSGTITATGAIYSSDRTLKRDIELISKKDIESVGKVDLKSYIFKDDETNRERYGVIAQELEDANLSNLVVEGENGKKGVDYTSFLILKIAQLEQEIKELKNR